MNNEAPFTYSKTRLPDSKWSCPSCGTKDPSVRYKGKTLECHDCGRWLNLNTNAAYEWRRNKHLRPQFTKEEFIAWSREQTKKCHYCGVPEAYVYKLSQLNDAGRKTQILGLDRKDSSRGYVLDNIVMSCLACNRAKGDIFAYEEFKRHIAPSIKLVYLHRLGFSDEQISGGV